MLFSGGGDRLSSGAAPLESLMRYKDLKMGRIRGLLDNKTSSGVQVMVSDC